nr:MAG TPA: hypothetical protein [Caudoviricetes sp.]
MNPILLAIWIIQLSQLIHLEHTTIENLSHGLYRSLRT